MERETLEETARHIARRIFSLCLLRRNIEKAKAFDTDKSTFRAWLILIAQSFSIRTLYDFLGGTLRLFEGRKLLFASAK